MKYDHKKLMQQWERRRLEFQALVAAGWTYRKIAEANGLSVQRVQQIIKRVRKDGP